MAASGGELLQHGHQRADRLRIRQIAQRAGEEEADPVSQRQFQHHGNALVEHAGDVDRLGLVAVEGGEDPRGVVRVAADERQDLGGADFRVGMAAPAALRGRDRLFDHRVSRGLLVAEDRQAGLDHGRLGALAADHSADERLAVVVLQEQRPVGVDRQRADQVRDDPSAAWSRAGRALRR